MYIRNLAVLALMGATGLTACSGKGDDSSGNESDADTDADTDSDTDADTDSDTDVPWNADTVSIQASFTYDQKTNSIVTGTYSGKPLANIIALTVYNNADSASLNPTEFCFATWELPVGPVVLDSSFDKSYWLSFDLSKATFATSDVSSAGTTGDCEGMASILQTKRGDQDLATFFAGMDVGFGVHHMDDVANSALGDWEDEWSTGGYEDYFGDDWDGFYEYMSGGAFTLGGVDPNDMDIVFANAVDSKFEVTGSEDGKYPFVPLSLEAQASAPTAHYETFSFYAYGSGF